MSNVILCNGNYAKTPYYVAEEDLHLFSVEELCYYLYKNAFLLTDDFFSDELLLWIREELGLPVFSDALEECRKKEDILQSSVEYLFLTTGYYGQEQVEKLRKVLNDGSRLTVQEKRKLRADAYCKRQKYALAISEYEEILKNCEEDRIKLKAKLYHNMGTAYAGMFVYGRAAEYYQKAFQVYPNTESYVQYLTALKLHNSPAEYLSYLSEHPESYEDSLEVESRLKRIEQDWERISVIDVVERVMNEEQVSYYTAVDVLLKQAKEEYTNMVNKG